MGEQREIYFQFLNINPGQWSDYDSLFVSSSVLNTGFCGERPEFCIMSLKPTVLFVWTQSRLDATAEVQIGSTARLKGLFKSS